MKYIRTKDGIMEADTYQIQCVKLAYEGRAFKSDYVIKQADTIEELCDNFMVEYANGEHMVFPAFYHLKRHHDLYNQDYHHVAGRYGCIWVAGKGLIYVAKMNENGEFELI